MTHLSNAIREVVLELPGKSIEAILDKSPKRALTISSTNGTDTIVGYIAGAKGKGVKKQEYLDNNFHNKRVCVTTLIKVAMSRQVTMFLSGEASHLRFLENKSTGRKSIPHIISFEKACVPEYFIHLFHLHDSPILPKSRKGKPLKTSTKAIFSCLPKSGTLPKNDRLINFHGLRRVDTLTHTLNFFSHQM